MSLELQILTYLATYTYLTKSQLAYLGVQTSDKTFYRIIKRLREPACHFIDSKTFAPHPTQGTLEHMHYLRSKGRAYLIKQHKRQAENILAPIGSPNFTIDYDHRKKTIRIHLFLRHAFVKHGYALNFFHTYFT